MNAMTIWWWFEDVSGFIKEATQKLVSPIIGNGTSPLTQNHLWRDRPPWLIVTTMNRVTHEWGWFWGRGRKIKKSLMMISMRWPMTGQTTLVGSRAISSKRGSSHPGSHCHHFQYYQLASWQSSKIKFQRLFPLPPHLNLHHPHRLEYHQHPIIIIISRGRSRHAFAPPHPHPHHHHHHDGHHGHQYHLGCTQYGSQGRWGQGRLLLQLRAVELGSNQLAPVSGWCEPGGEDVDHHHGQVYVDHPLQVGEVIKKKTEKSGQADRLGPPPSPPSPEAVRKM